MSIISKIKKEPSLIVFACETEVVLANDIIKLEPLDLDCENLGKNKVEISLVESDSKNSEMDLFKQLCEELNKASVALSKYPKLVLTKLELSEAQKQKYNFNVKSKNYTKPHEEVYNLSKKNTLVPCEKDFDKAYKDYIAASKYPLLVLTKLKQSELNKKISNDVRGKISTKNSLTSDQHFCNTRPYNCGLCHKNFKKLSRLYVHLRTHTGQNLHYDVFGKSFTNKSLLNNGENVHTPYVCHICKKEFHFVFNLNQHILSHIRKRSFCCDVCGKLFTQTNSFYRHKSSHGDIKPFVCVMCNETYSDSHSLHLHVLRHIDEKPFQCDICQKTFHQRNNLIIHKHIHKFKPYLCVLCRRNFKELSQLREHIRDHILGKLYTCDVCGEEFTQRSVLNSHKHVHIQLYACDMCDRTFTKRWYLNRHKVIHSDKRCVCISTAKKKSR